MGVLSYIYYSCIYVCIKAHTKKKNIVTSKFPFKDIPSIALKQLIFLCNPLCTTTHLFLHLLLILLNFNICMNNTIFYASLSFILLLFCHLFWTLLDLQVVKIQISPYAFEETRKNIYLYKTSERKLLCPEWRLLL